MADFALKISPNILQGTYSASRVGQFASRHGTKFMLITDPVLKEVGITSKLTQSLSDRNLDFFTFDQISRACDTETIKQALKLAKEAHIHAVIAAGGGKTLSLARAVCSLFNESAPLYELIDASTLTSSPLALISVPTTFRDPFIFSNKIPVVDARSKRFKLMTTQTESTQLVIFDSNTSAGLSENQIASTALETLAIASEAYLSQRSSFFSDMFAEKSVELLGRAISGSKTLSMPVSREELLEQGGCLASLAAATSAVGTASITAYCVNARFKISRSLVAAILLPYVLEDCAKFKCAAVAKLSLIFGTSQEGDDQLKAAQALAEDIRAQLVKANLPTRLKDLSLSMEDLSLAAEDAGTLECINALPKSMTSDDLFDLVKLAY